MYSAASQTDSVSLPGYPPLPPVLLLSFAVPPVAAVVENPIVSSTHRRLLLLDFVDRRSVRRRWIVRIRVVRRLGEGLLGRVAARRGSFAPFRCSMHVELGRDAYRRLYHRRFRRGGGSVGSRPHERWLWSGGRRSRMSLWGRRRSSTRACCCEIGFVISLVNSGDVVYCCHSRNC